MKTRKAETVVCHKHNAEHLEGMCQPTNTPTPWSVGRLLITAHTRNWSVIEKVAGEIAERKRIFSNFHADDEGKSRQFLAECQSPEDAAFIVRCTNNFEKMLSAMKQVKESLDKKRYGDRKEGELEGYFALCDAINEAEK